MTHKTISRDGFDVAGLEIRASNDDPGALGALWGRFLDDPAVRALQALDDYVVALYCDYEADHTKPYTFILGRRVESGAALPPGLVRRHVPAGRYALFLAEGEQPAQLIQTWGTIWETPIERRFETDYEIHRSDTLVEVYVGV